MADTTGGGHGGLNDFDGGAGANGRSEVKEARKINNYFIQWNPKWLDVSDRRATTVMQNLINIVNNTNKVGLAYQRTLSHHFNAFNGKATGVEIWYFAGDTVMKKQAEKACAAIASALGLVNRGAKATTSLYVVSNTIPHCLLIEWCFIDNPNDMKAWDKNGVKAMNACMKALNMSVAPTSNKPAPSKPAPAKKTNYHSLVTGRYVKGSAGHKALVAFCKEQGMKYKEYYRKDKVWLQLTFSQGSSWKTTLEKYLQGKNWNYVLVLPGQENLVIDSWK